MLVDAVASFKFITKKKSDELIEKIVTLGTPSSVPSLKRNLWSEGRIKQENERIYFNIEAVNQAINEGKKISFQYFQYDVKKEQRLKHDGTPYKFSPYALVWNGDYYYMVGYSEKHDHCFGAQIIRGDDNEPLLRVRHDDSATSNYDGSWYIDCVFSGQGWTVQRLTWSRIFTYGNANE